MLETVSYIDQILIYTVFGLAANLILGYTGVLQAAPAAFGAFGGYAVVYLTSTHHLPWIVAVVIGVAGHLPMNELAMYAAHLDFSTWASMPARSARDTKGAQRKRRGSAITRPRATMMRPLKARVS